MSPRSTTQARRRARSFRLGDTPERRSAWLPAVIAFVVAAVVFGGAGYLVGRPGEQERMAEDIRASDAVRDKEQIKALTDLARTTKDDLAPVVSGLRSGTGDVAQWQQVVDKAVKSFDDPPSGSTATNVARGSLAAAVDQLALAVGVSGTDRKLATEQLDLAVTTWSIGATQLDQVNVDAGYGHQHVYLDGDPEGEAFTPDGAEEGTG
ncbi:hypothetical protein [Actinophytocola oryzae]|uniref:Uncharacterized protein n=1 Tax=Actinophytocola oryzae TaxID=502181 RepID=A0A4R7W0D4_9PSEU|nr:hypothetical protein [Actinophytocola oryzae]TDV54987.1 hypothetical protein CLV71_103228 [Actinophytocola oryzae]